MVLTSHPDLDYFVQGICAAHGVEIDGDLWGIMFSGKDAWPLREAQEVMRKGLAPIPA